MRYFKSLIPTFGKNSLVMLTYWWTVGIKLLIISHVRILFLVSLLFVAMINPYSVFFKFSIFKYSSILSSVCDICTYISVSFWKCLHLSDILALKHVQNYLHIEPWIVKYWNWVSHAMCTYPVSRLLYNNTVICIMYPNSLHKMKV